MKPTKAARKRARARQQAPLYVPTDNTPENLFQAIGRLRREAEDEIERLLAFLDSIEPDPDLEPTMGVVRDGHGDECEPPENEPDLGWTDVESRCGRYANIGTVWDVDREAEPEHNEDGGDLEPSLGFSEPVMTGDESPGFTWPYRSRDGEQHETTSGSTDDREGDESDLEPSLCGVTASAVPTLGAEDAEQDQDDEDGGDAEPSLGRPEDVNQDVNAGAGDDREQAREPDAGPVETRRRRYRRNRSNVRPLGPVAVLS